MAPASARLRVGDASVALGQSSTRPPAAAAPCHAGAGAAAERLGVARSPRCGADPT